MRQVFWLCTYLLFSAQVSASEPLFPNSVVSNDLEFIKTSDQSVFACVKYTGQQTAEMPHPKRNELMADGVYRFSAIYKDGSQFAVWVHPDVGSQTVAERLASQAAEPAGKLPTFMRSKLSHIVVHAGDGIAFSEDRGRFFVLFAENMQTRIRNHDLEETVFHEAVHATLDIPHATSSAWRAAQRADPGFVTAYAARKPKGEDLAESALFAWAIVMHPGRLPSAIEDRVREVMPNRLAFLEQLLTAQPKFYRTGEPSGC